MAVPLPRALACILIPVHNGGSNLKQVLRRLVPYGLDVWVVDDGSTDGSAEIAQAERAKVVRLNHRSGKGAAIRRGLSKILKEDGAEWVIFMDGDGQHLPEEIPVFLQYMDGPADFLIGSRMDQVESFPKHRLLPNRIGSEILRWMSGQSVPDTQCGYRAVRISLLKSLVLESSGFEIETEILLKALRLGARWRAVPVSAVYNGQGSHFRPVYDTYRICMAALRYVR